MPENVRRMRLRLGIQRTARNARVALPAGNHGVPCLAGSFSALWVAAVVVIVNVAVPAFAEVILTGLVDPKLSVGA
jgi:hypothetical protein